MNLYYTGSQIDAKNCSKVPLVWHSCALQALCSLDKTKFFKVFIDRKGSKVSFAPASLLVTDSSHVDGLAGSCD